jgi:DNA-binding XRE family transcriptional regulator
MNFVDEDSPHFKTYCEQQQRRIGLGIKRLREANGLTQMDLADMLNITRERIASVEVSKQAPAYYLILKVGYSFNMTTSEFLRYCAAIEL